MKKLSKGSRWGLYCVSVLALAAAVLIAPLFAIPVTGSVVQMLLLGVIAFATASAISLAIERQSIFVIIGYPIGAAILGFVPMYLLFLLFSNLVRNPGNIPFIQ